MTRPHTAWIIIIALLACYAPDCCSQAIAAQDFKHPPYPLGWWVVAIVFIGMGNGLVSVGFVLPVAGHACQWTRLMESKNRRPNGTLAIVDQPMADSIMIIPH